jgi:hypothetical protein
MLEGRQIAAIWPTQSGGLFALSRSPSQLQIIDSRGASLKSVDIPGAVDFVGAVD